MTYSKTFFFLFFKPIFSAREAPGQADHPEQEGQAGGGAELRAGPQEEEGDGRLLQDGPKVPLLPDRDGVRGHFGRHLG